MRVPLILVNTPESLITLYALYKLKATVVPIFPLSTKEDIKNIARVMLENLRSRLKANDIEVSFEEEAIEKIAEAGFDPVYGARPLRRTIQSQLEDMISEKIIDGEISSGDSIKVIVTEDKLDIEKNGMFKNAQTVQ